ncbi:unnamed protein product [Rotaria magnacalcarata]|uniref:Uncharacterized protein n=2 Tax=Rotaria magnacalcarata TaxID=392030 RepID=A0A8S2RH50_9BILA|nr:unnamed protein product [Rotaria magnacalcarata]CAF4160609.1 unnamed protein product [Rotaria magnacalcarata]
MNSTLFTSSATTIVEPWFLPIDILRIIFSTLAFYKAHILLSADSCLAALVFASDMLGMGVFALQNDLKHIQFRDSLCIFSFYVGIASCTEFTGVNRRLDQRLEN